MDDDDRLSPIEHVRMSFRAIDLMERTLNRTDRLMQISLAAAMGMLCAFTAHSVWQALAIATAYVLGAIAGVVQASRVRRRATFRRLKDQYHEIELQHMIEESDG